MQSATAKAVNAASTRSRLTFLIGDLVRATTRKRGQKQSGAEGRPCRGHWPLNGALDGLLECLDGGCFVVFHVEHGIQFRDLQQVVNLLREIEQFELAALVPDAGVG